MFRGDKAVQFTTRRDATEEDPRSEVNKDKRNFNNDEDKKKRSSTK